MLRQLTRRFRAFALGGALLAPFALGACDDGDPAEPFVVEGEGSLDGTLFYDVDRDGVYDPFAGDVALSGVTVVVRERGSDQVLEGGQTTTNAQGQFSFSGLPAGTHDLYVVLAEDVAVVCQNPFPVSVRRNETTNVKLAGQESCLVSIEEAREQPIDDVVTVRGVVTVASGNISSSYFWIQDETAGIKIFMPFAAEAGQFVEVTGLIEHFSGEIEISRGTVTVLGNAPIPDPIEITGEELVDHSYQGSLVTVRGLEVTNVGGTEGSYNVTVKAPDGAIFVIRVDSDANIASGSFVVGNVYDVTGVVGPFGGAEQLYVRSNADIAPAS